MLYAIKTLKKEGIPQQLYKCLKAPFPIWEINSNFSLRLVNFENCVTNFEGSACVSKTRGLLEQRFPMFLK